MLITRKQRFGICHRARKPLWLCASVAPRHDLPQCFAELLQAHAPRGCVAPMHSSLQVGRGCECGPKQQDARLSVRVARYPVCLHSPCCRTLQTRRPKMSCRFWKRAAASAPAQGLPRSRPHRRRFLRMLTASAASARSRQPPCAPRAARSDARGLQSLHCGSPQTRSAPGPRRAPAAPPCSPRGCSHPRPSRPPRCAARGGHRQRGERWHQTPRARASCPAHSCPQPGEGWEG